MNWNVLGKYAAGTAMLGSVFYLVLTKQVDAQVYIGIISGALAGLGFSTLPGPKPPAPPAP